MFRKSGFICIFLVCVCISDIKSNLMVDYMNRMDNIFVNKSARLSDECATFYKNANIDQLLKLYDASSKFLPYGLLQLNFYDLGSFDECYDTKDTVLGKEYYGKYCFGSIPLSWDLINSQQKAQVRTMGDPPVVGYHFAHCLPDLCTLEDFHSRFPLLKFSEGNCYTKATAPELSNGAIVTTTILSFFAAIVVLSTIYETVLYYKKRTPAHEFLIAFSGITNGKKIFTSSNNPDQLLCLNGIKAISMVWIIAYHEYMHFYQSPIDNYLDFLNFSKKNMFAIQGFIAVDTFFAMGGLVLVYTFMKAADKGIKFNVLMSYVHRYFRLTPVLAMMVLIHMYLLNYMGNGPFWREVDDKLVKNCEEHWWSTLLYIENFVNPLYNCVPQSWYLSADMQMFVLSPIVLIPLRKWPKFGVGGILGLILAGMIVPFTISYVNELPASGFLINEKSDFFQRVMYFATYSRFGPYVIGMLAGYIISIYKKNKKEIKLNKILVLCTWVIMMAGLVASLYGSVDTIPKPEENLSHAMYNGIFRSAWATAVCIIALLCITGYGGIINSFLSLPFFQIISKLSYCMYTLHYLVIIMRLASTRTPTHFSNTTVMFNFWGDFMLTLFMSFFYCITFELPFVLVEKYVIYCIKKLFYFCLGKKHSK